MLNKLYQTFIAPKARQEDAKRREFILNVLLSGFGVLSLIALLNVIYDLLTLGFNETMTIIPIGVLVFTLIFLMVLSRRGYAKVSAYILIFFILIPPLQTAYLWGVDLPQGLLVFALIIVMAGILVNSRFAFMVTFLIGACLISLTYLQYNEILQPDLYWTQDKSAYMSDMIVIVVTMGVIALVSWLSNREMEKALRRARLSEKELKKEKDLLEIRVEERTRDLKKAQVEKLAQMSRFAEFGKLSSGFFHDLMSPLTALSLNIRKLQQSEVSEATKVSEELQNAFRVSKKMENFVSLIKKQMTHEEVTQKFSLNSEIEEALEILNHKSRQAKVEVIFQADENIETMGNPLCWHQVVANLLSNALEAYDTDMKKRLVEIGLRRDDDNFIFTIKDYAKGIEPAKQKKVFDPFFTEKKQAGGSGIGLYSIKEIVEQEFGGEIELSSQIGRGTEFTIICPIKK